MSVPTLRIERDSSPDSSRWDAFVGSCANAHFEQASDWAAAKQVQGWTSFRLLAFQGDQIIAGAQVLTRSLRRWVTIGMVSRGPLFAVTDASTRQRAVHELLSALKRERLAYVVVVPPYGGLGESNPLDAHGFFPKPELLPPSRAITATLELDLTKDLDSLLAGMRTGTRYDIRKGLKENFTFHEEGSKEMPTFFRLMTQLCERRGTAPTPAQPHFFDSLVQSRGRPSTARLFFLRREGIPVAAALAFALGGALRVWKVGWSGEFESSQPNKLLWWHLIRWAKAAGLTTFDFVQILPHHAQAVLKGEKVEGDPYWGVTQFKLGFGGALRLLPEPQYRSHHFMLQTLLRLGGARVLGSPFGIRWVQRFSASQATDA
ncbi:MAG: GNAT family N-acetyltransferase [Opitutaceae bacterium]